VRRAPATLGRCARCPRSPGPVLLVVGGSIGWPGALAIFDGVAAVLAIGVVRQERWATGSRAHARVRDAPTASRRRTRRDEALAAPAAEAPKGDHSAKPAVAVQIGLPSPTIAR
jgi:hypothetical protein